MMMSIMKKVFILLFMIFFSMPVCTASDFFHYGDKKIRKIGDMSIYYFPNGEINKIGDMDVYYEL